ncbi:ATP-binding cassette domain-containing protein [Paenibacillus sp. PsM32]|uniref:ABC transporter ATP-binding protein n=1 Tax=unclassified Paenibacillus TaxID=185978 RepID=UPI0023661B05|nr:MULTISPECIES: ATP-binding cassette domain-containing protein [unclassified Paenibacillus]MDN4617807.1 ATP-binding cassette domain-containing protein [Paenibacillus sp. PsM32]MDQ1234537.1 peptide/nickel transport system ATP-binding protein [Paenibacillus sp. SORGH_AS_0306]MDR6111584.1 peptide/nickel transport system ATP-binding protein [Paenibacillus sp. SORGH_AS_0338]WDF52730.1 ATP-binding cassette domain-containing protein [Paenibacillus sp. KACC 21273]
MALLELNNLKVHYPIRGGFFQRVVSHVKAVDGLSIQIEAGKTYGLVGESGCGKTTTGRAIIGLNKITDGNVTFEGQDLTKIAHKNQHSLRRDIQMIFQDPYSSLNGRKRVLDIIAEPLRNFENLTKEEERRRVQDLLEKVGLNPEAAFKYPHEFSGGQRQRIGIARALTLNPKLIIADEPVSALDVSVQAQVLNFMKEIQKEFNLTYLFISHDLGIVRHMCDEIGIMYRGRLVEQGNTEDIYENPQHIYTKRLISAIPNIDPAQRQASTQARQQILSSYQQDLNNLLDPEGKPLALKSISSSHQVALP